jgi:hypothetical protein
VRSREVALLVRVGGRKVALRAWCRVGVWTTLQEVGAAAFVARETWGRLGQRQPRLLTRVMDQALRGVVARLRPEADGSLSFLVEIAESRVGSRRTVGIYHGRRVTLGDPRRHGIRFAGRAPPDRAGAIARWGTVTLSLAEESETPLPAVAVRFSAPGVEGFVAGRTPMAEIFREVWEPADPVPVVADGVERMDFRLVRRRHAAGFRAHAPGRLRSYGTEFDLAHDE